MLNTVSINKFQSASKKGEKLNDAVAASVFGKKTGLMAKLFGCWHKNISRPFTQGEIAYRCCLECGARKQFNTDTLKTYGTFYLPPIIREECI